MGGTGEKEYVKTARVVLLLVVICFIGGVVLIYTAETITPGPQIQFIYERLHHVKMLTNKEIDLEYSAYSHETIKVVEDGLDTHETLLNNTTVISGSDGWPDAEKELGIAYPLMVRKKRGKRWNPNWVYRGSPVHPLPDYKSTC